MKFAIKDVMTDKVWAEVTKVGDGFTVATHDGGPDRLVWDGPGVKSRRELFNDLTTFEEVQRRMDLSKHLEWIQIPDEIDALGSVGWPSRWNSLKPSRDGDDDKLAWFGILDGNVCIAGPCADLSTLEREAGARLRPWDRVAIFQAGTRWAYEHLIWT